MKKTILSFGEVLWDLLPTGPKLGGAPCNFAYRVHSLGDEGIFAGRIGRDDLGEAIHRQLLALGMDLTCLQWDDRHPTGTVQITLKEKHAPDYFIVPEVAYDYIDVDENLTAAAARADCICFGTLIQRGEGSRRTLHRLLELSGNRLKLLDINLRKHCHTWETVTWSLEQADILKLNEEEAGVLAEGLGLSRRSLPAFCEDVICRWRISDCLVTLGDRGAFAATADRKVYVPGYRVEVVDTCGSGDAFTAGWIYQKLRGEPLEACCLLGNALGAIVASQPGATEPVATDEIRRFMETDHERIVEKELAAFLIE